MWRYLLVVCSLSVAAACGPTNGGDEQSDAGAGQQDGAKDTGGNWYYDGPQPDTGPCEDVVDVVFVLDVSSSMEFVLDKLKTEIDSVVAAASSFTQAPEPPHFGLIAFVDNYKLDDTGPLEGGKVHTSGDTLKTAFQFYKDNYTTPNRNPGDGLGGPTTQNPICEENSLDALYAAATEFPWRETSSRVVILVTDDTYLERPDNYGDRDGDGDWDQTNFPREGNYPALRTMTETVDTLKTNRTRVFSFTRLEPPGPLSLTKCGTGRRLPWAAVPNGWSQPYNGQDPIPVGTDGSNFDVEQVRGGTLSLSATINQVVLDSYCNPPIL